MPLKHTDPFATKIDRLDARVNPYVQLLRDGTATGGIPVAHGPMLKEMRGAWREKIAAYHGVERAEKLYVEIGCHKGNTLCEMAAAHPETMFVGIDITFKRVVTSAQRAVARGLKNVFCVMANATSFDQLFGPDEVDGSIIFFPDPWVKKKSQAKNRLVGPDFCARLRKVTKPNGFLWLKTDQVLYFEAASQSLTGAGFSATGDHAFLQETYLSTFEKRFLELGQPTYMGKFFLHEEGAGASPRPMLY